MKIIVECRSDDFFKIKETIQYYMNQEMEIQKQYDMKYGADLSPAYDDEIYTNSRKRLNNLRELLIMLA